MVEKSSKAKRAIGGVTAAGFKAADPADSLFRLEQSPFYWINRVSGRYGLRLNAVMKPIGMDVARWRVLMILTERGRTGMSGLADEAVFRLPTMTKTVQRMAAAGLVSMAVSAKDGRVTEVELTDDGVAAVEQVREAASVTFREAFDGVGEADLALLIEILTRVFDQLGQTR